MRTLAAALLLMAAAPAFGLEKCVGPDGKVTYSDRGCATGAKASTISGGGGGGASLAGAQIDYYEVSAPSGHTAHAQWYLSYTPRTRMVPGKGCTVEGVDTKLDLKVRIPRWNPPPGTAADATRRWERYLDALRVHEAGHLQVGRDFESGFRRAALEMTAPDCGALSGLLRARFDALLAQSRQRDLDYDAQTRHGATQGAVF